MMSTIQHVIRQITDDNFSYDGYLEETKTEFLSPKTPKITVYTYETIKKAARIALEVLFAILSVIFFPLGIYRLIHWLGGRLIVPAQLEDKHGLFRQKFYGALQGIPGKMMTLTKRHYTFTFVPQEAIRTHQAEAIGEFNRKNGKGEESHLLIAKRISILVDERRVDAMILGERNNLSNRRWAVLSNGNGSTYETMLAIFSDDVVDQIHRLGVNFLLYNYQGVGTSEGVVTKKTLLSSHKAMLRFLEDEKHGIGAKEIVQIGPSLGGGVQGDVMMHHRRESSCRYALMKYQTFSKISKVPKKFYGFLIKLFGWEIGRARASSLLLEREGIAEIVVQRARKIDLARPEEIEYDGLIPTKATHAYNLLQTPGWEHKRFIGTKQWHFAPPRDSEERAKIIEAIKLALSASYNGFARAK